VRDWHIFALYIGGGLALGWLVSKLGVRYVESNGQPPPFVVGVDPTANFTPGTL
jgi:hypothetical protein